MLFPDASKTRWKHWHFFFKEQNGTPAGQSAESQGLLCHHFTVICCHHNILDRTVAPDRQTGLHLTPGAKAAHMAVQVSLLFSNRCTFNFNTQHPCCVKSKCTCIHLYVYSMGGLVLKGGVFRSVVSTLLLWHQKCLRCWLTKSTSKVHIMSCYLQGALLGYMNTGTVTRRVHSACDTWGRTARIYIW